MNAERRSAGQREWILWVGSATPSSEWAKAAVSVAASKWQAGLLGGLAEMGVALHVISVEPERAWPKGPMVHPGQAERGSVGYLNLPGVRGHWAAQASMKRIREVSNRWGRPSAVLTYNASGVYGLLGERLQSELGVPWVPFVADYPVREAERWRHKRRLNTAAGRVYLSWSMFASDKGRSLHLDGGVHDVETTYATPEKAIMYAGTQGPYGGLDRLLDAVRLIPDPDLKVWICGKGDGGGERRGTLNDTRVKYLGLLAEEELRGLSRRAAAFVNPRPTGLRASRENFPSKILEYLSYCKPVVSTWTDGLAPDYRECLIVTEGDEPGDIARAIGVALRLGEPERRAVFDRIGRFLLATRTWNRQAERVMQWLRQDIVKSR